MFQWITSWFYSQEDPDYQKPKMQEDKQEPFYRTYAEVLKKDASNHLPKMQQGNSVAKTKSMPQLLIKTTM